ncbi:MAG: hypothetical protein OXT70_13890 [Chloroflexota bacterium]|nr:hypothetical protein [Chloroflexota bacterium]
MQALDVSLSTIGGLMVSWDASARVTGYDVACLIGAVTACTARNQAGTTLPVTCEVRPEHQTSTE